jgi:hypothetical protein
VQATPSRYQTNNRCKVRVLVCDVCVGVGRVGVRVCHARHAMRTHAHVVVTRCSTGGLWFSEPISPLSQLPS